MISTVRAFALSAIAFAWIAAAPLVAVAGPGHDHDHGPAQLVPAGPSSPRIVAVTESYELVGILTDGRLVVYLDRLHDTSPVRDARLEVTLDSLSAVAEPQPDGTYIMDLPGIDPHGSYEVIIAISEGSRSDLLVGTLKETTIGAEAAHGHSHEHTGHDAAEDRPAAAGQDAGGALSTLKDGLDNALQQAGLPPETGSRLLQNGPLLAGAALAIGILIGALARRRSGLAVGLVCLVAVFGAGVALAGPGHDHGPGGASSANGDAPRRLPDGEIFLPKPTQRLLDVRTRILQPETVRASTSLIGRVIADPNRSGLVQSTIGGRVKTAQEGLPVLGQRVRAGQILAYVEPTFAPIDASDVRQTAGDLAQRIAVLDARIARQTRLVDKEIASRANLEDLEIERDGLVARRKLLLTTRNEPEALVAPVDGVIAEVRVSAGQVVTSAETLFNIVDPASLWIEAISFDPRLEFTGDSARARTSDGELFDLSFVGRSRALQQQATVLQFRVTTPGEALHIGSPVKVLIETGKPVTGLIVPRGAVAQAPNGQMVVFKRLEPERYLPMAVRFEKIDGERVNVTGGIGSGDQVIVRGAPLVNQIR